MAEKNSSPQPLVSELAGDPDFAELLTDFLSEMPKRISALESALSACDLGTLARLTHQLRFGVLRLSNHHGRRK
jgi:HPt (histidine-containing phosphotransfer) domain-containing protein